MADDSREFDIEIIRSAYSDKVKEAFLAFAENMSVGQSEKSCKDRFLRAMALIKKARDVAIVALEEGASVLVEASALAPEADPSEGLSEEDRALIESALSGTTGVAAPRRLR